MSLPHQPGRDAHLRALQERVNRICNVLVGTLGFVPGNRVLLRSANNPMMVAAYLAVLKAGGVVVATMPLLRAKEIAYPLKKAKITIAFCDHRLAEEMERARTMAPDLQHVVYWGSGKPDGLEALIAVASPDFTAVDTAADDVCLIGFTSGTTGEPKGTMHFHRDMLAICDGYGANVLRPEPSDRFIGSPPLAFTFGLGGIVLFPMHVGASTVLLEKAGPDDLLPAITQHKATICFTAPTAYRAMLSKLEATTSRLAQMRLGRRAPAGDLRGLEGCHGNPAHGRDRRDGDAAHLHRRDRGRDPSRRDRQARSWLRGQGRRRRGTRSAAGQRRPPGRARADWMPLSRRRAAGQICAGRLEHHRRHLPHG